MIVMWCCNISDDCVVVSSCTTQSLDDVHKHHQTKQNKSKVEKGFSTLDWSYTIGDGDIIECIDGYYALEHGATSEWLIASWCILKYAIRIWWQYDDA